MRFPAIAIAMILAPMSAQAEWQGVEVVQTYPVSGATGAELYASIGQNGPLIRGATRAIAHTNFRLTWTRKYENRGNACVLASARPKLIITYTLPKPANTLSAGVDAQWRTFIAGISDHEHVHGDMIRDLVRQIETATIGLSVAADPQCRKIRAEMTRRLTAISAAHQQRNRDFDKVEMGQGGNIHRLILGLVNER